MRGPEPHYQSEFPSSFVEQARDLSQRRTVPHQTWQRARLVVLLDEDPARTNPAAAREVGVHENTVRKWRKRWAEGDFSLDDKPGRGRKRTYAPF